MLRPLADFAAAGDAWDELAHAGGNIFATREWLETWWRHFGGGRPLRLTGCVDPEGRLVAVLPLYEWKRVPIRVLRFLGHGPSDELAPPCAPADRARVAAAFREGLDQGYWRWRLLLAEQLLARDGWAAALDGHVVRHTGFPVLPIQQDTWEAFLAARSANFRQQYRRRERKLEQAGEVRYRLADAASLERDLETLFDLHDRRWGGGDSPFTGARKPFHREFAALAVARGWLRLWLLELDGQPIATWYGFRFAGAESYYQAGRDPSYDELSVGYLILMRSIGAAVDDGLREYRFLRGDEPYKYRFTIDDPGLEIVARGRGALGSLAVRAGIAAYRSETVRRLLRRRLEA